ncbi:MAG: VCBS repeat-containing protein [Anaerolineales bacterium]|nr:VCBS repeat-containing protein [Anaerolineales bacterium]
MRRNAMRWSLVAVLFAGLAPGLAAGQSAATPTVPDQVERHPLAKTSLPCIDVFAAHVLPHVTAIKGDVVRMFDANGSGVAAGDLDGDGDIDLLLGNQDGPDTLLWNDGPLAFRKEEFSNGNTRDVKLIDVDADGRLDIVLTRKSGTLNFFHNQGAGQFKRQTLPGVAAPAYLANWADLDRDGDLDLVTATYDAGLLTDHGNEYIVTSGNKGVYYYENKNGHFSPTQLAKDSQALALIFPDLNGDGRQDILVGNDFLAPDMIWLHSDKGWQPALPFEFTTHSTMSLDYGDVNRDGAPEIFAADMKPYSADDAMDMMPVMDDMMEGMTREQVTTERQLMENMLQMQASPGKYLNLAPDWSVDGTGWSWSGKFGDLDNDGWLDLYVVNGMIEERLFAHMPRHELVEENQAFRNEDGLRFRRMPSWDLDGTYSGRGMVMVDFDEDGDLDIVINNLRGPAQLYENLLCTGDSLEVDLRWPESGNTHAMGATARLTTDQGVLLRDVRRQRLLERRSIPASLWLSCRCDAGKAGDHLARRRHDRC